MQKINENTPLNKTMQKKNPQARLSSRRPALTQPQLNQTVCVQLLTKKLTK